jgi:hypothetical protein
MEISIKNEKKISDIQLEFNTLYPYLKLEFFSKPHKSGGRSNLKFILNGSKIIGECRTISGNDEMIITPTMTVNELEQGLGEKFGIGVQVFRQSGKVWLETTFTDGWTLEVQNSQGEDLSKVAV